MSLRIEEYLSLDDPGQIIFYGSSEADLFTAEIADSLDGVLQHNYLYEPENAGFMQASIDGRPWTGTMWTRDAGTMIRELVHYGYLGRAALSVNRLIQLIQRNPDGYFAFPEYFKLGQGGAGDELDGTCAILIAILLLRKRLLLLNNSIAQKLSQEITEFITQKGSVLRYIIDRSSKNKLAAGTGEFGGGCYIKGEWCNSVQNSMIVLAITLAADELECFPELAAKCRLLTSRLKENILQHLTNENGFIWCVDPRTMKSDPEIIHHPINEGFTGINGIGAMSADVEGLHPVRDKFWAAEQVLKTYDNLLSRSTRKHQVEQYGFYSQFDLWRNGLNTSASYGFGYVLQLATIFELPERDRMLSCFVEMTRHLHPDYHVDRSNPNWFLEQYYSPDIWSLIPTDPWIGEEGIAGQQGCGALNLVNVAEPLKVARLIAGIDNTKNRLELVPRLPVGYAGVQIKNWTVINNNRLSKLEIDFKK